MTAVGEDCECEFELIAELSLCSADVSYMRGPLLRRCDACAPPDGPLLRDRPLWRGPSGETFPAHEAQHLAGESIRLWPARSLDLWADYGNVGISDLDGTEPTAIVAAESVTTGPVRRPWRPPDMSWVTMERIRG